MKVTMIRGPHRTYVILTLSSDHWQVLLLKPLALTFLAQNTTCIMLSSEPSSVIIATCQQWKHPALDPMAYFWKELHGFTIIAQTGREKGRVGEQQEKKSFQSGWTDQLPGTPCCSGQARVPVTSCPILILSAEFPEDRSCCCLQTTISARSTWERTPLPPSFFSVGLPVSFLLTQGAEFREDEHAGRSRVHDSQGTLQVRWPGTGHLQSFTARGPQTGSRWAKMQVSSHPSQWEGTRGGQSPAASSIIPAYIHVAVVVIIITIIIIISYGC